MQKRGKRQRSPFLLTVCLIIVIALIGFYMNPDSTGSAVFRADINPEKEQSYYQYDESPIQTQPSYGEGESGYTGGAPEGGTGSKKICECEIENPDTNNCPNLGVDACISQGKGGCMKKVSFDVRGTEDSPEKIEKEIKFNCKVFDLQKCGCIPDYETPDRETTAPYERRVYHGFTCKLKEGTGCSAKEAVACEKHFCTYDCHGGEEVRYRVTHIDDIRAGKVTWSRTIVRKARQITQKQDCISE